MIEQIKNLTLKEWSTLILGIFFFIGCFIGILYFVYEEFKSEEWFRKNSNSGKGKNKF